METTIFSIFLGVVQGATEFLPISSSGHLAMLENLPFFQEYTAEIAKSMSFLTFNIFLHFGTLLAMLYFWRKDVFAVVKDVFVDVKKKDTHGPGLRRFRNLFIALLPLLVVPFIKDYVDQATHSLLVVAIFFIINGIVLIAVQVVVRQHADNNRTCENISPFSALCIGLFQLVAILPGISRSGSTISAGNLNSMKPYEAVRFSFLLGIPTLLAATFLELKDLLKRPENLQIDFTFVVAGTISAFIVGLLSIKLLVWLGHKAKFASFGIYTMALGVILLIFFVK